MKTVSVSGETIRVFSPKLTQHLACSQILVSASGALHLKVGSGVEVESHVLESVRSYVCSLSHPATKSFCSFFK